MSAWFGRWKTCLCAVIGTAALSVFFIFVPGTERDGGGLSYAVTIRHYGIDAAGMERSITIPLEDAMSAVPGVRDIQSITDNGRTRVFAGFDRGAPGRYEAVRDAAQRVYEALPPSVQRPEIQGSSGARVPLWTAAVTAKPGFQGSLSGYLERTVKPRLESLEGSGEVEISGTGTREIAVILKQEKAASAGLTPDQVAAALATNDVLLPAGRVSSGSREILVVVDGRYGADFPPAQAAALAEALIPLPGFSAVRLKDIADVYERDREPEILSRLNGLRTAVIAVLGNGDGVEKLSRMIRGELGRFSGDLEFTVLSDRGAEEAAAYRSVLVAALEGAVMVALAAALFTAGREKGLRTALVCALSVPFICLVSAGLLSSAGFVPGRSLMGGIAAGVGSAVDTAILSAEKFARCGTAAEGKKALRRLFVPLVSGTVTTIAALLPLTAIRTDGAASLAWAVAAVNAVSLVTALVFLPPFFLGGRPAVQPPVEFRRRLFGSFAFAPERAFRHVLRVFTRLLAFTVRFAGERPLYARLAAALITAAGILAVILAGADPGVPASENSVYAHVEFDGGLRVEEADRRLAEFAGSLMAAAEIKTVQTSARTGSGSALITFDPEKNSADRVREAARAVRVYGGFVYFPETSPGERIWEISVSGDDGEKCRELAEEAAALSAGLSLIRETVLNFKDGPRRITFIPDRERLTGAGLSFYETAETARRGVHGQVAYKKTGTDGEIDVRIRGQGSGINSGGGAGSLSREETAGLLVKAPDGILALDSLMLIREDGEPAGIRRENRRRTASISVRTKPMDPRRVREEVMKALGKIDLPPGYAFEFDREAVEAAEALSGTVLSFLLALLFCYMAIASINESFTVPLAVLSVAPPSMAVPAVILAVSGSFNAPVACAFVAVTGMSVNSSVLVAGEIREGAGLYRAIRNVFPALMATAGTTVAGALPFLFLREDANTLMKMLALVTVLGVGSSCVFSLVLLPGLVKKSHFH
ncbi:MAG: efflux RND transporter permease subunit [Treponema sp.]|jgi:multidrug efflux pump subunit AcrB|nr:efflux RND transporter permease subunit [Treponema sp.]